jgi:hypothetical protein
MVHYIAALATAAQSAGIYLQCWCDCLTTGNVVHQLKHESDKKKK